MIRGERESDVAGRMEAGRRRQDVSAWPHPLPEAGAKKMDSGRAIHTYTDTR